MNDLHSVLERATDGIEPPHLATAALEVARSRRTRRHGAVASLAAAGIVAAIILAPDRAEQVQPAPAPHSIAPTPPAAEEPQRIWDPRKVDELPVVASVLGPEIEVPSSATPLAESPIEEAVLSVDLNDELLLLSPGGEWRSVPVSDRQAPASSLFLEGTRLMVPNVAGAEVWDLATGIRRELSLPEGYVGWDFQSWRWVDRETVLFDDYAGGWLVDVATDSARRVPYPRQFSWAVDEAGSVIETNDPSDKPRLVDWAGGTPRPVDLAATGTLIGPVASQQVVVGTTFDTGGYRIVVVDRTSGEESASLPINDFEGNYSGGGLRTVAILADGTILMKIVVFGPDDRDGWRLVAWDPITDDLAVWTASDANPTLITSFATDLLG